jgi:hypothetical protein
MPTSSATATPIEGPAQYSFLASHGLRSPLSAIRWACGRLRKTATGSLNEEQRELIDEIHANAKILTTVLGSMQLLGKLEDRTYKVKGDTLMLCDMLTSLTHGIEHPREITWSVHCPADLTIHTDGPILESILVNMLTVCTEAGVDARQVYLRAEGDDDASHIALFSSLELPFLASGKQDGEEVSRLVGGIPGLMLCLASAMAQFLGGSVTLHETTATERAGLPPDFREKAGAKLYRMTLTMPS